MVLKRLAEYGWKLIWSEFDAHLINSYLVVTHNLDLIGLLIALDVE